MPPSPANTSGRIKRLGLAVGLLSLLLILFLFALIWQSTARMDWRSATVGLAPGIPTRTEEAVSDRDFGMDASVEIAPMPPIVPGSGAPAEDRARVGERVIRNASLSLRVDDAETRLGEARAIAAAEGGFVANATVTERDDVHTARLTIRVPEDAFERALARLKELASTVFSESTNAEDVTAQFVDLEARLNAAKAEEAQYLEILKRADTIEETLQVTARLGDVRARIESMEGQLRYLRDRTEYATISVTMTEEARVQAPTPTWRPGETFRESLRELVIALQGLADVLIALGVFLVGLVLPVVLVLALIIWAVRGAWKNIRSKK